MLGFKKKKEIFSPAKGQCIDITDVKDDVFSSKMMGDGIAISPEDKSIVAPVSGNLTLLADTKHAFGIQTKEGLEILVHIGIDTVELGGEGFSTDIKANTKVKKGETIVTIDKDELEKKGYDITVILILLNGEKSDFNKIKIGEKVYAGEKILEL